MSNYLQFFSEIINATGHSNWFVRFMLLAALGLVFYFIAKSKKDRNLFVRRIAGIDAVQEAVGRAAELGRPISFTTGLTTVGPILYACLGTLFYVIKKAAKYRTRVLLPQNNIEVMAIADDLARQAYSAAGRSASYDSSDNKYFSEDQFAFTAGYLGMVQREKVGSAFLFGEYAAESLILAEAGRQVGAMQVAASTSPEQSAFFITTCDYTLIGEELFATSAYLTKEPIQLGSLMAQDRLKLIFLLIIVIGCLLATFEQLKKMGAA